MDQYLDELIALGFSGVQNFPTVGLIDGTLVRPICGTMMSAPARAISAASSALNT
jgi:predicted TIM-barrel enzyme